MLHQTQADIVSFPKKEGRKAKAKAPTKSVSYRQRLWRQHKGALFATLVCIVGMALSLSHQAHGIAMVTNAPTWEGWAMAIVIDLGFVSAELAPLLMASPAGAVAVGKYSKPMVYGTLAFSAVFNAIGFGLQAEGWYAYPAVAIGLFIPASVYWGSRQAFVQATKG